MGTKGPGLIYNGSQYTGLASMDWWQKNGLYCLRPSYLDDCPGAAERYKIGYAAGSSSRQLGVRLSNHASALVDMTIIWIVTVDSKKIRPSKFSKRKKKNPHEGSSNEGDLDTEKSMANILEKEAFAWLTLAGFPRVKHQSGVVSEYFTDVPMADMRRLFDHLTTIDSVPVGPSKWMPMIGESTYWFGNERIDGAGMKKPPSRFHYGYLLPTEQEEQRRRLNALLKKAVEEHDGYAEKDLRAMLQALLSMSYIDVKSLDDKDDDDDDTKTDTKDDDDDGGGMTFVEISDSELYSDEDTTATPAVPDPATATIVKFLQKLHLTFLG